MKILIVDDEPLVGQYILGIIKQSGTDIDVIGYVTSGEKALSLLSETPVDVVFTDITMPRMSGIELLTEIKARWPQIDVIMLTCHESFDYVRIALDRHASNYVLKTELTAEKTIAMYGKFGVFSKAELQSRAEVKYELYAKTVNIEAKAMINVASKQIVPAVIQYAGDLAESVRNIQAVGAGSDAVAKRLLVRVTELLDETQHALDELIALDEKAGAMEEGRDQAVYYHECIIPAMAALRRPVDELEQIVDKAHWPMPSYGDLLFEV